MRDRCIAGRPVQFRVSRITHHVSRITPQASRITYHASRISLMSILIAEDMAFQRDYLRAIVTDNFADAGPVIEANDGNSAVKLALQHRPSLVILDIKMPGLSGVKVAKQIWSELLMARIIFWSQYKDEIYIRELAR